MPDEDGELTHYELKQITEILKDAAGSTRLSEWQEKFVADMQEKLDRFGLFLKVSDKQWAVIRQIEQRIYGT